MYYTYMSTHGRTDRSLTMRAWARTRTYSTRFELCVHVHMCTSALSGVNEHVKLLCACNLDCMRGIEVLTCTFNARISFKDFQDVLYVHVQVLVEEANTVEQLTSLNMFCFYSLINPLTSDEY